MQADKLKQQEEEDAKQRADELAERERLREEAKREREAVCLKQLAVVVALATLILEMLSR